ncbi:MAG: transcriptional repressor [Butyribacter sp.]|nr:transcriptional repressor [bacterium]MDY3854182.1 transcriptional repressor [Butyribacter sp.]
MAITRRSKQRDAIKSYLMSTTAHPTAETVYENLRKDFPNISLGTIYRNLNFLVEHGEALRLDCGDGMEHFDGNPMPHNHFYCRGCHRIIDLEMAQIDHINIIAGAQFDGLIEDNVIYFRGLCKHCKTKDVYSKENVCN